MEAAALARHHPGEIFERMPGAHHESILQKSHSKSICESGHHVPAEGQTRKVLDRSSMPRSRGLVLEEDVADESEIDIVCYVYAYKNCLHGMNVHDWGLPMSSRANYIVLYTCLDLWMSRVLVMRVHGLGTHNRDFRCMHHGAVRSCCSGCTLYKGLPCAVAFRSCIKKSCLVACILELYEAAAAAAPCIKACCLSILQQKVVIKFFLKIDLPCSSPHLPVFMLLVPPAQL